MLLLWWCKVILQWFEIHCCWKRGCFRICAVPRGRARSIWKAKMVLNSMRAESTQPRVQVPVDKKGRPYPYLLPSPVPGMPATICFKGTPEEKQHWGLVPLKSRKLLVRFNGIANTPVRLAFLKAGFRCARSTRNCRWHILWGSLPHQGTLQRLNRRGKLSIAVE